MQELLKELNFDEEQIKRIMEGMANKKIYTSAEENIDLRYSKLKEDFGTKETELEQANGLIQQLQKGTKDNETLQEKITEYETKILEMQEEQRKKDIENAIKLELLKGKAKPDDIDYLIYKIRTNKDKKLDIDENGKLKDFKVEEIKKEFKNNFEDETTKLVDVKELGGKDLTAGGTPKPNTMLEALKEKYTSNEEM